jgi:hypothetical protein
VRARLVAPAALLAVLSLAGCGRGTSSSSTAGTLPVGASSSTTDTDTDTDTTAPASGTSRTSTVASARLSPTRGYGTYEACQGRCTGSVPTALRRPLHLPATDGGPCPITINVGGPVSPRELSAGVGFHRVAGSPWLAAQITWVAAGSYTGPVLIRGASLDGDAIGFGTSATPYDELQLLDAGRAAPRVAGNGRAWVTSTRIPSGGCYAYQADGTGFSEVVVFRAVG